MRFAIPQRILAAAPAFACFLLCACHEPQVTKATLIGTYHFVSDDPEGRASDQTLDRLDLNADGKFDLVEGGSTKPRTEVVGTWTIIEGPNHGTEVMLEHSGYPIEITQNEVRLLVDLDVGIWWAKTR
jgi:hypothetical protein